MKKWIKGLVIRFVRFALPEAWWIVHFEFPSIGGEETQALLRSMPTPPRVGETIVISSDAHDDIFVVTEVGYFIDFEDMQVFQAYAKIDLRRRQEEADA